MTVFLSSSVFADRVPPSLAHSAPVPRVGPVIRVLIVTEVRLFRDGL